MNGQALWQTWGASDMAKRLHSSLLGDYIQESQKVGTNQLEQDYLEVKRRISSSIQDDQRRKMGELMKLYNESSVAAMLVGIQYGLSAAFQNYYTKQQTASFEKLFQRSIVPANHNTTFGELQSKEDGLNARFTELYDAMGVDQQEELVTIAAAWDERQYGIMMRAYLIGFEFGIETMRNMIPDANTYSLDRLLMRAKREVGEG